MMTNFIFLGLVGILIAVIVTLVNANSTPTETTGGGGGGGDGENPPEVDTLQLTIDKDTFDPQTESLSFVVVTSSSASGLTVDLPTPFSVTLICETLTNSIDQAIYFFDEENKTSRGTYETTIDFSSISIPENATSLSFYAFFTPEIRSYSIVVEITDTPVEEDEYILELVIPGTLAGSPITSGVRLTKNGVLTDITSPFSVAVYDETNTAHNLLFILTESDKVSTGVYNISHTFEEGTFELQASVGILSSAILTKTFSLPVYTLQVVVNGTDADTDLVVGVRTFVNDTLTDYPGTFTIEVQDDDTGSYFFEVTDANRDSVGYYTTTFSFGPQTYTLKAVLGNLSSPVLTVTFTPSAPSSFLTLLVGNLNSVQNLSGPVTFAMDNSETEGGAGVDLPEPFEAEVYTGGETLLFIFTEADKVLGNNGRYEKTYEPTSGEYDFQVFLRKGLPGEISSPNVPVTFIGL
jgi:hypothetical protein